MVNASFVKAADWAGYRADDIEEMVGADGAE